MPPRDLSFQVLWYGWDQTVIGATIVKRHDLSDAITTACNMLKACRGAARDAHGFFVREAS